LQSTLKLPFFTASKHIAKRLPYEKDYDSGK
jgi:hypothetical protein